MIKGIACIDHSLALGKTNQETGKGELIYNIRADMKHFIAETRGNVVVFGKTTYDSLSKQPLPNRLNLVLWDQATSIDCLEGCLTFKTFDQLLYVVKLLAQTTDAYICGGASIYKLFMPYYDELIITKVNSKDDTATAYFPEISEDQFKISSMSATQVENDLEFRFITYKRK